MLIKLAPLFLAVTGLIVLAAPDSAVAQLEPGFVPVYTLNIPTGASYDGGTVPYTVDNSASIAPGSFSRVAYLLTLAGSTNPNSPNGFVYVSFDTFTNDATKIGVPNGVPYTQPFQQYVTNMNIASDVLGVFTGTVSKGNIEFWNSNYDPANTASILNASGSTFDFGDNPDNGTYGSMQVHDYQKSQTVFAYNNWGGNAGGSSDLGIGNSPVGGNPDWTFRGNAGDYTSKTLQVFVEPVPEPGTLLTGGAMLAFAGLRRKRRGA